MIFPSNLHLNSKLTAGGGDDSITLLGLESSWGMVGLQPLPASQEQKTLNVAQLHQGLLKIMVYNHRCALSKGLGSNSELGHGSSNMSNSELRCHTAGQCHGCHIIEECENRKSGLYYTRVMALSVMVKHMQSFIFPFENKIDF